MIRIVLIVFVVIVGCGRSNPTADPVAEVTEPAPVNQTVPVAESGSPASPIPAKTELTEAATDEAEELQPAPMQDDAATLEAIGKPDEALVKNFEHAPLKDVKARLSLVKAGRLAALRKTLEVSLAAYEVGMLPWNVLTQSQFDLALAELDYSKTPASRLAALKSWVAATSRVETEVGAKRDAGARGGDSGSFYATVAARLKAEERLVREMLAQRAVKSPDVESPVSTSTQGQAILELLKGDGVSKTLEAIGRPDEAFYATMERASLKELEARLTLIRAGRLAALSRFVEVQRAMFDSGAIDSGVIGSRVIVRMGSVVSAEADYAEAQAEYIRTPEIRLSALHTRVASTSRLETEVGAMRDVGARGGDSGSFYAAVAARLKAEERLMRELLAERVAKSPRGEVAELTPHRGQAVMDLLTKENGVEETLEVIGKPDGAFLESMEHASLKELQSRLTLIQAGRIAALLKRLQAVHDSYEFGERHFATVTVAVVLQADLEFNQAKIDYIDTPAIRLSELHALVASTARLESEVREKRDVGALGGDSVAFYAVIAGRLFAEELLLREIVAQRKLTKK